MEYLDDYQHARREFLAAATASGGMLRSIQHPLRDPEGERIYVDVAWLGRVTAPKVLMVVSGVHGIEGLCGSNVQTTLLASQAIATRSDDVALCVVHALNPFGVAWCRRANEDGVDLCRNFLDFAAPLPSNPQFAEVVDLLVPSEITGASRDQADAALTAFVEKHGDKDALSIINRGQYDFWHAPFFGGHRATWSNLIFRRIVREHLQHAHAIACVDVHTGLIEHGRGELLCFHQPGTDAMALARRTWGSTVRAVFGGESSAYPLTGGIMQSLEEQLSGRLKLAAAHEFGTTDTATRRNALRSDHWLWYRGNPCSADAKPFRTAMKDAYYPPSDEWRRKVWVQAELALQQALGTLTAL